MAEPLEVVHAGRRAIVTQNDEHPERYLWIDVDGKHFFLGVLERHMKRGDVRRMALTWLHEWSSA